MPFEHADIAHQDRSVALFTELGDDEYLDYAIRHREVIRSYGRFPHRNRSLGRQSTAAELEYLAQPGTGLRNLAISLEAGMNLTELDEAAWIDLELAGTDPNSGLRHVNLCTVNSDGRPQARLVVLRSANGQKRTIEIHTDTRSDKWRKIGANPSVTLLAFDPARGQQLRLRGTAERNGPGVR